MRKFAVIDIGSNSVRLMLMADGKVLYKRLCTTRLGEGLAQRPRLKKDAISRSAVAVAEFYGQAKADGAEAVCAFATAAVRSAENASEFLENVRSLCPLEVDVIAGEVEAEIGILGALGKQDGCVIDVGGASTEIVVRESEKIVYKKSVNIGAVRLKDLCGRDKNELFSVCEKFAEAFVGLPRLKTAYAIGGTATTLAAWRIGLERYDPERITGTKLSASAMHGIAEELLAKTVEEIAAFPCMPQGRADIIAGGAVLLQVLMDKLGIETLVVSDRDNLEGYAIKKGWLQ